MKNLISFSSFVEMTVKIPDDKTAREYLEQLRWDGKPVCAHCGCGHYYQLKSKGEFKGLYRCGTCRKNYSVTVGTIFEGSHIGLRKWLIALFIFSSHKKGISSHQLAKDLAITQKSAWFMLGRLRLVFTSQEAPIKSSGVFSFDESLFYGKMGNKHLDKRVKGTQGRNMKTKALVFGAMHNGKITARVVPNAKRITLMPIIKEMVGENSTVVTDDLKSYRGLAKWTEHIIVNHKKKQYVNNGFSTNNVENFWSHMKRGIYGLYHHCSRKHLQRYASEFEFRFNTRKSNEVDRFDHAILRSANLKLTYQQLIAKTG